MVHSEPDAGASGDTGKLGHSLCPEFACPPGQETRTPSPSEDGMGGDSPGANAGPGAGGGASEPGSVLCRALYPTSWRPHDNWGKELTLK